MKLAIRILAVIYIVVTIPSVVFAQEIDYDKMLTEDIEVINPVYMPVVGFGAGYLNFMGDVTNNTFNPLNGSLAFKANMHAYIDNHNNYKFNLYVLFTIPGENGTPLTVNQRNFNDPSKNFRIQTDIFMFGTNAHYDFAHFVKKTSFIKPFVSLGAEFFTFSTKADLSGKYNGVETPYHYWTDGTIRDLPQADERPSKILVPDGVYETNLMRSELNTIGKYNEYALAIPIGLGFDLTVSNRTNIRLGYTYHFAFTDNIDNISEKNPIYGIKNNRGADNFGYTYASLHFDLFSDPKFIRNKHLFLSLEDFDAELIGDEDGDFVLDINDYCLGTPRGIAVDTLGCPFDDDMDGVPNYLDKEPNTRPGAIVDADGVEMSDAMVWNHLGQEALPRDQVEMYLSLLKSISAGGGRRFSGGIPEKFKTLDTDEDGYISFDEVLRAIDAFFDFDNDLSTEDIYELNDFFFEQ